MKKYWKDAIYVLTIIIMVMFWFRDEAKEEVELEVTMREIAKDVAEIKTKINRHEEYWLNQMGVNTRLITIADLSD